MTVRVGIPVSLTGQFGLQGAQTLAGITAWAEDVNRSGGLRVGESRDQVKLLWRDDCSRRDRAKTITEELIVKDRVDLLIGPYSAVLTNAAAEIADAHGKLLWNQGGASPQVYERGSPWVVGILTPADQYLAGLLPMVRETIPAASTVAILRAATGAFPSDAASGVERSAANMGLSVVLNQQFNAETEDFSPFIQALGAARPDVLAVVGRFQNDLRLAEQLAEAAPAVTAVAVVAAGIDAFRERLGEEAERFIGPSQWELSVARQADYGPTLTEVRASLRRQGYPVIDYPSAQAYAVGVVVQRCVEECGSLRDADLRQAAAALDFPTFYGRFRIDPGTGRQVGKPALLVQWQHGSKEIVWPPELGTAALEHPWR